MGKKRDYYDVLSVNRNASESELKKAYRKLALENHPDRNPGNKNAENRFKEAAEAYEVLRNPQKRQIYDQYGHDGLEGSGFSGFGGFQDIFSNFSDIFEDFFGFGKSTRKSKGQDGSDLRYDLHLDFLEAINGVNKDVDLIRPEVCKSCKGSGSKQGTSPTSCSMCNGSGEVTQTQGFFTIRTTCRRCNGSGVIVNNPCNICNGVGKKTAKKIVSLKIPPGVDSGSRLRLTGEGEPGINGGNSGDLYVFISVEKHSFFQRDGLNIICQVDISFVQATLGCSIFVPTLDGESEIHIPKGTQTGSIFYIKGKGIPSLRTRKKGDQIIQVNIKMPLNINKKQAELLKEFAKLEKEK
jgi:molecular chaperone DnaJ